jgi:hypothetical protein
MEDKKKPDDEALDQVADAWASVLIDIDDKKKANAGTNNNTPDIDADKKGGDDQST